MPRGVREAGLALIVAGAALLLLASTHSALMRSLETASLDLRFRIRGIRPPGPETAVVLVDDRSLAALGRWPLSRHLYAKAVRLLDRDGAKVIVFDMLFPNREQPVPPALQDAARVAAHGIPKAENGPLHSALRRLADDNPDKDFAKAIQESGRVLLPLAFAFTGKAGREPPYLAASAYQRFDKSPASPEFPLQPTRAVLPIPTLATMAAGLGHVTIAFDRDGAPRYDYLALPYNGDFIPSLPVRAVASYLGVPWKHVALSLGAGVQIGPIWAPTDAGMRLLVNYRGPRRTIPTYSFLSLINGKIPPAKLRNRVVLIGGSFLGASDSYPAPFGSTPVPGTEREATIIDTLLHRRFISEDPSPWPVLTFVAVIFLAMASGFGGALLPARVEILVAIMPMLAWCGAAQCAFLHGLWLPLVSPLVALATAIAAVLLFRYRVVDAEGRAVKTAFRHYLAPEMVNVLAAHPERLQLGGETRVMTFLFCDIRGFTSISERLKGDPEALTRLINRFLTPMTEVIMVRRGTIDKYMGDCIMAFWNAPIDDPDHANRACESALAMIAEMERLNREWQNEARGEGRPFQRLHVGIGINTGACVVGNMGSDQRFDYSVLGDAVNLASRLEGQTKTYSIDILVGETTRRAAPSWAALELDLISVKGKEEAVRIYGLLGDESYAQSDTFKALALSHEAMLDHYRLQDWLGARAMISRCRGKEARLEALYDLYEERIMFFMANPPGHDWKGIFIAPEK